MISARCINLIRELGMLQWPENVADRKDEAVKPIGSDHALDALAYLLESEKSLLQSTSPLYDSENDGIGEWKTNKLPNLQKTNRVTAGYFD